MKTVGILLAAGRSVRYGSDNKLLADFGGQPLCRYAADAMAQAGLAARIAVVRDTAVAQQLHGFAVLHCSGNQSDSLKAGVRQAIALDADQVVICLADMPFVTAALIAALLDLAQNQPVCGCALSGAAAPPVVFPRSRFADLLALSGDRGAGALLRDLPNGALMTVDPQLLVDLDSPTDFESHG